MEPPPLQDDERRLLEQIGDVFLTEDRRADRRPPAERVETSTQRAARDPRDPRDPRSADDDHPLHGPAPIRLRPKVEHAAASPDALRAAPRLAENAAENVEAAESNESAEAGGSATAVAEQTPQPPEADRAATDSGEAAPDGSPGEAARAAAELVVPGNLPGISGPWLTQYAQLIAEEEGPVAIVHADDEAIEVELVEPQDATLSSAASLTRLVAGSDGRLDAAALLDAAVRRREEPVRNVLLHADPNADRRTLERCLAVDDWTLLTGADDAAVVAGYAAIKRMAEAHEAVGLKHVGLMFMGYDEAPARRAADKIAHAADSVLHFPVRRLGHHKRMVPVKVRQLGSFPATAEAWDALVDWFQRLEPPGGARRGEAGRGGARRGEAGRGGARRGEAGRGGEAGEAGRPEAAPVADRPAAPSPPVVPEADPPAGDRSARAWREPAHRGLPARQRRPGRGRRHRAQYVPAAWPGGGSGDRHAAAQHQRLDHQRAG